VAHSLSAKKRVRQTEKRRAQNRHRKVLVKDVIKSYTAAITSGDVSKAEVELQKVVVRLDKTAATKTIHKNAASRKRSRLTKRLNALKAAKAGGGTKAATA